MKEWKIINLATKPPEIDWCEIHRKAGECLPCKYDGDAASIMYHRNPARMFWDMLSEIWQSFPPVIQAMIGMVVGITVLFGIIQMIRT
jgi:hypothetical protein